MSSVRDHARSNGRSARDRREIAPDQRETSTRSARDQREISAMSTPGSARLMQDRREIDARSIDERATRDRCEIVRDQSDINASSARDRHGIGAREHAHDSQPQMSPGLRCAAEPHKKDGLPKQITHVPIGRTRPKARFNNTDAHVLQATTGHPRSGGGFAIPDAPIHE